MTVDALAIVGLLVAAAPFFTPSPRAFSIAIVIGLVALPLLARAMLSVPSISYAGGLGAVFAIALTVAVFLLACVVRSILLAVAAARRRKATSAPS